MKTAVFVDGAFFIKRFAIIYENNPKIDPKNPEHVAKELQSIVLRHLKEKRDNEFKYIHDLYRIFFYDCPPLDKKVQFPVSKKPHDFSKTSTAKFTITLHDELRKLRKTALRLGRLQDFGGWKIKAEVMKDVISGARDVSSLADDDFFYEVRQKSVDMKIGIDIASVAYKKQVERIVLIAGDSDFVPAAKLARREGIDFILDPMHIKIASDLFEHIDGLHTTCFNVKKNRQ